MSAVDEHELLRDFARTGAEDKFRELVARYSDLVFGTAFRVVRDSHAAEEITQNVFIALARKAASLPADTCLAAWLHRSAVLESKNWIRGEVRRRQREEIAGGLMNEKDESLLAALTSVLDDALLDLREKDRAALLARFVQQRSLKEVGESLGVSEDTAQKRVGKAIELLTKAFRRRGYQVPTAAVTLAVLQGAAHSAPAGLIGAVTAAGVAASATYNLGTFALLAAKFMSLTKTQTATVCVLLGAAPVAYHWQVNQKAYAEQRRVEENIVAQANALTALEERRSALARGNIIAESELAAARANLSRATTAPQPLLPPPEDLYTWSDESDYVRLPKELLKNLRLTPQRDFFTGPDLKQKIVGRGKVLEGDGSVSPVLLEALGLNSDQSANVQSAFRNFAQQFETLARAQTHSTNIVPPGVGMHRPAGAPLVTLRTVGFPEEGARLRAELEKHLTQEIGSERTRILLEDQARRDFESEFLNFGKYDKWIATIPQEGGLYSFAQAESFNGVSYSASVSTVRYDQLPPELQHLVPPPSVEQSGTVTGK